MGFISLQLGNEAEFKKSIRTFSEDLNKTIARKTAKVANVLFSSAVKYTPVRTGRARASWRIGVHVRDQTTEGPVDPKARSADPAVIAAATQIALRQLEKLKKLQPGTRVYVTNVVPYIVTLDKGTSTQAPRGITALALADAAVIVRALR